MAAHEPKGIVDSVSIAYIVGGIPAMTAFFVVLFILVHLFDIPA
ncbi:hypothetical protein MYXO_02376 [Myxococcaceae bacterium]|jgi:hypothetical protein|nr:hypothetical protein MYXO_02376 [Myxococcaceae bacterium]